jgi:signal transduction histidine kinase
MPNLSIPKRVRWRVLVVVGVGVGLLSLWWTACSWYEQQLIAAERAEAAVELSSRAAALQTALAARFALLDGMVGLVQSQPSPEAMDATFEPFATSLLSSSSSEGIRNFALFPDGQVRYEYPPSNNVVPEAYRNLYSHPVAENRASVARTLASHRVALGQPRELGQGGLGLVATQAVFVRGQLWGFVTMALDVPPILAEAGVVGDDDQSGLHLALADGVGNVFVGSPDLASSDSESIPVPLPEGEWQLYAAPGGGWSGTTVGDLRLFQVGGLLAVTLVTLVCWLVLSRHERLAGEKKRLEQLEAGERDALARAERSRGEAEQALATRDLFLRTLAHDLKAPLISLSWGVQMLLGRATRGELDAADMQGELSQLVAQTAEAVATVDELQDLTRVTMGAPVRLVRQELDLAELVKQVVAQHPPSTICEVRYQDLAQQVPVVADRARLGRVVRNLLDNAIKYSPPGGVVLVRVCRQQAEDPATSSGWAEVCVMDQGLGIPAADLPHVFERYRRGGNVENISGEGLGLASVLNLVKLHGGEVLVESQEGMGSTFTVRLPLAASSP